MNTEFPKTINELFNNVVAVSNQSNIIQYKRNGEWRHMSAAELSDEVRAVTAGLYSVGVRAGDRVGLLSENRPEWVITDLAILSTGAADVPVYATSTNHQVAYLVRDSGMHIIFVSTAEQRAKIDSILAESPNLNLIVSFDETPEDDHHMNYSRLVNTGKEVISQNKDLFRTLSTAAGPDDLATLIYTSGTTGEPKGVMLTQRNLISNVYNTAELFGVRPEDIAMSYLPLSHVFERATVYNYLYLGVTLCFAEGIDQLPKNFQEVRPTFMTTVPRMFEKIYGRIIEKMSVAPFPKKQIASWSMNVGRQYAQAINDGKEPLVFLKLKYRIADRMVFKLWRQAFGGRMRSAVSGGAALPTEIGLAFLAAGIEILQGYGLTETTAGVSTNTIKFNRIGTVGKIIPNVQVKLASDGEILVKGDNITKGYYNRPDADAESFDEDAWFRTGDIGQIDADGYLTITDRKKDLIKTSGGKYIAPQPIENMIKVSRFISQIVVIGNGRKYASALIVPNRESLRSYAKIKGINYSSEIALIRDNRIVDLVERQVAKLTTELARYETIKRVVLLEKDLTIEGGELTPTLKVKRRFVEEKYKEIIDGLYEETSQAHEKAVNVQQA